VNTVTAGKWIRSDKQLARERLIRKRNRRRAALASASTVVVLGVAVAAAVSSPGWERVQETFFSWSDAKASFPEIARSFWLNVKLFMVAEPIILAVGLAVAIVRGTRSAYLFPLRALAVIYTDLFRGVPTLLVVFLIGFGLPALRLQGIPSGLYWLALIALVLSYGAYVAEVFRAGIASVHPSQRLSARARGLTESQAMRHVVLPQAVRNVVPPLLNDFVSLQKDTALVATIGLVDALNQANIYASTNFNYTPYVVAAMFFVALTVPLARLTDWLARRAAARQHGGVA